MGSTTLDALRDAYIGQDIGKQRSPGTVTLSAVGGCRKRSAFRLAGQAPEFVVHEARAAFHGTAIHDHLLHRLGAALAAQGEEPRVEFKVSAEAHWGRIHGQLDLHVGTKLIDLKTVGEHGLSRVHRYGATAAHVGQTGGYAQGLGEAGIDVTEIEVLYVDRANGDAHVEQVDVDAAVTAAQVWMADVHRLAEDPDAAPRDEKGPGLSIVCDGCEFMKACWGPDAVRGSWGAQRILRVDDAATAAALEEYERASLDAKDAEGRKAFARALLDEAPVGDYGALTLAWTRGSPPKPVPDLPAMRALLESNGLPVPTKMDNGRRASIRVKPSVVQSGADEGGR